MMHWMLALLASPASACTPVTEAQINAQIQAAEVSFARLDTVTLQAEVDRISSLLPCVTDRLGATTIALWHQLQGFRSFIGRDLDRSRSAFTAARRTLPGLRLPADIPATHPMALAWSAVALDSVPTTALPAVPGQLWVDGVASRERPSTIPALLQWEDARGHIRLTTYLWPEEPLPAILMPDPRRSWRIPLAVTAGLGATAAGLFYWRASADAAVFWDAATPDDELPGLQQRVNGWSGAMVGASSLGVAAGLGLLAVSVKW